MPWGRIERALAPAFARRDRVGEAVAGNEPFGPRREVTGAGVSAAGRPRLPIRLMAALRYLKRAFNLPDEELVAGSLGDALHTVLRGAGYNLRWSMRAAVRLGLKGFWALALWVVGIARRIDPGVPLATRRRALG